MELRKKYVFSYGNSRPFYVFLRSFYAYALGTGVSAYILRIFYVFRDTGKKLPKAC